jgi:hypothetical protein
MDQPLGRPTGRVLRSWWHRRRHDDSLRASNERLHRPLRGRQPQQFRRQAGSVLPPRRRPVIRRRRGRRRSSRADVAGTRGGVTPSAEPGCDTTSVLGRRPQSTRSEPSEVAANIDRWPLAQSSRMPLTRVVPAQLRARGWSEHYRRRVDCRARRAVAIPFVPGRCSPSRPRFASSGSLLT